MIAHDIIPILVNKINTCVTPDLKPLFIIYINVCTDYKKIDFLIE